MSISHRIVFTPALAPAQPHETHRLPHVDIDDPMTREALTVLMTATHGFAYPGDGQTAVLLAVRFLRSRPDVAAALGIGASS